MIGQGRFFGYAWVFLIGWGLGHFITSESSDKVLESTTPALTESRDKVVVEKLIPHNDENGWRTIQVFRGDNVLPPPNPTQQYFSQVSQDELVTTLLQGKRNGFFIDLAANDAIQISNTLALERNLGWKGICIEANPAYWSRLANYRTCQVVGAVVGGTRGEEMDFVFNGVYGGIIGFDNKKGIAGIDHTKPEQHEHHKVRAVTLLEILRRFSVPPVIDYLSLDVEGAETVVMQHFPFADYVFKIMTVERPKPPLQALLKENGYEFLAKISKFDETIWVHSSFKHELDLDSVTSEKV